MRTGIKIKESVADWRNRHDESGKRLFCQTERFIGHSGINHKRVTCA